MKLTVKNIVILVLVIIFILCISFILRYFIIDYQTHVGGPLYRGIYYENPMNDGGYPVNGII